MLIFQGTLRELHTFRTQQSKLIIKTSNNGEAVQLLALNQPQMEDDHFLLSYKDKSEIPKINKLLVERGIEVYHLEATQHNLEQLFIDLTTRK